MWKISNSAENPPACDLGEILATKKYALRKLDFHFKLKCALEIQLRS